MVDQPPNVVVATLYGGPAGKRGRRITLRGVYPEQWPDYICTRAKDPKVLAQHFRHIAGRVYEHQGPCVEFPNHVIMVAAHCPDCGAKLPSGDPVAAEMHVHEE